MDETSPVGSDAAQAEEAWPVLGYGTPEAGPLAAIVRGVGWLLLVVGGIGFAVQVLFVAGWLISSGGFGAAFSYGSFALIAGGFDAGCYLLLAAGGLLCRRHHPAAANLVCAGAAAMVLSGVLVPPAYYYFFVLRGGWIGGLDGFVGLVYQTIRGLPTALLPLLLLYLFTRPLIRDAIGIK